MSAKSFKVSVLRLPCQSLTVPEGRSKFCILGINSSNSFSSLFINHDARIVLGHDLARCCSQLRQQTQTDDVVLDKKKKEALLNDFIKVKDAFRKNRFSNLNLYMAPSSKNGTIKNLIAEFDYKGTQDKQGYVVAGAIHNCDNAFDLIRHIVNFAHEHCQELRIVDALKRTDD